MRSRPRHDTLILIPARNEAGRIGKVLHGLARLQVEADVLVIDDGSGDNTAGEAQRLGAMVIHHPFNLGYGVASGQKGKFLIQDVIML